MNIESLALIFHISTISVLAPLIIMFDLMALGWVVGKPERIPRVIVTIAHFTVWYGLALMIGSGLIMFSVYHAYLLTLKVFYLKMFFVAALIVNGFIIGRHYLIAAEHTFASLSKSMRLPLFISGAVSVASWVGVIICALMLGQ